jgi:hypothetical protein
MKKIIIFVVVLLLQGFALNAQEISATVTVNTEQLSNEALYQVATMADDVKNYINNQKFLDKDWEGEPIPVDLSIVLSGGTNNKFAAKLYVVSKRAIDGPNEEKGQSVALRIIEKVWYFEYARGANFTYNTLRYDQFVSMIDFYMLLAIGFDMDTYGELDGAPAFEKARTIFSNAVSNGVDGFRTNAPPGEMTKHNIVSELTDMRFEDFRKAIFSYFVDGLDIMFKSEEKGKQNVAQAIGMMADFKKNKLTAGSAIMQLFFDAKYREIATLFNGSEDVTLFRNLVELDPANTMIYNESKEGKYK